MRLGAIAFLLGILGLQALPELPTRVWVLGLPGALAILAFVPRWRLPAWIVAGFLWALWLAPPPASFPSELEGIDLWMEGWIATIPDRAGRSTHFEFVVARMEAQGQESTAMVDQRLRLSWWDNDGATKTEVTAVPPFSLRVGDRWGFTVRLKRPHGLRNPGGFDYERWLYAKGIIATGTIRSHPTARLLAEAERYPLDRYRQQVTEDFKRQLPGNPHIGILSALAVGERGEITPWQWEVFTRTGVGHLVAISGTHIGLIAGMVFGLIWGVWSRIPALALRWPATQAAALAALIGAGSYTLFSGLSVPAQRAFLMLAVAMIALIQRRPTVPSRVLALALLAVLIVDPEAPLRVGFWLSFGAVAAILYSVVERRDERPLFGRTIHLQLHISLALLPLLLLFFQQFPLFSPLANLIAIPWVACTVLPLTLLAVLAGWISSALQALLLEGAALTLEGLWHILLYLDQWRAWVWYRPEPPLWVLAFAIPGVLLLLAPRGLPGRWLGVPLYLPLLWPPVTAPPSGGVWFTLLDVGPGLAAVVRTQHHALVYDTGPRLGADLDAGRAVIVPFLRQQGVVKLDTLIVSHADRQHTGGVRSLREQMPIDLILSSSLEQVPIKGAERCQAGQEWEWDGVRFRLLHPPVAGFIGDDASCVLQVIGSAGRVLLPGDIETDAETALVTTHGAELAADVLIAPHQGRRNLSVPAFLAAVQPRYVLFATGYQNRFGYPRPETVTRYRATGATLLDASYQGALTFQLEPDRPLALEQYRLDHRRYWTTP